MYVQAALTSKDEALAKAHEDLKERITLLRRVQDLEMENADLHTMMQKFDQANVCARVWWRDEELGGEVASAFRRLYPHVHPTNRRRSTRWRWSTSRSSWTRSCR